MGLTLGERIIASHCDGRFEVGDIIEVNVDWAMTHEMLGLNIMPKLEEMNISEIKYGDKIVVILDHWSPPPTVEIAEIHRKIRRFVKEVGIRYFYDVGFGICHQVMVEEGFIKPGLIVVGTDSHSTTYGAFGCLGFAITATDMIMVMTQGKVWLKVPESVLIKVSGSLPLKTTAKDLAMMLFSEIGDFKGRIAELKGNTILSLNDDEKLTVCNSLADANVVSALIEDSSSNHLRENLNAEYADVFDLDVSNLEPLVALPHSPFNIKPASELEGEEVNQVFIGTCTNGRVTDLAQAAKMLKGRKVSRGVRLIVIPASRKVYLKALEFGYIKTILEANGIVGNPTCGPCIGGQLGVLASGENCISTSSRNYLGRMGSRKSKIYLASPITAAAAAITGYITDPRNLS